MLLTGSFATAQQPSVLRSGGPVPRDARQWFHAQRAYPSGTIPEDGTVKAMAQRLILEARVTAASEVSRSEAATSWSQMGPAGVSGPEGVESGHVTAIVTDSRNADAIYVAASGGGVWRSSDSGGTWRSLGDNLLSLISGSLALDERNGTLYYGTGDNWGTQTGALYGAGIFRSPDGGGAWVNSNGWDAENNKPQFVGGITPRIVLHPSDPRTIFVARNSGLWRSTDGGDSWVRSFPGRVTDVAIDPANPNRVYAALGATFGDASNGLWRSNDGGRNWEWIPGLPAGNQVGRISLALAPSNPAVVYVVFTRASDQQLLGVYRSPDAGTSWAQLRAPSTLFDSVGSGQGFFDNFVAVHPRDPNVVYLGGVELWKSSDGGANWTNLSVRDGRRVIHEDQFCLAFKPGDPETIYVGNEGGIYKSSDGGNTWQSLNTGLPITQFNSVAVHPQDASIVVGGTQGQGLVRFSGSNLWNQLFRGDGGQVVLDPSNPSVIYSTRQRIQPMRSVDGGVGFAHLAADISGADRVSFYPPLAVDPSNSSLLYFGTNRLWMSSNSGRNWTAISNDLTNGGTLSALAVAEGAVFCGSSDGMVTVRNALGFVRTGSGVPNRWITAIALDPRGAATGYLTVSGFGAGHVFRTADGGATWSDISGNLPDAPANAVVVDPRGGVYVATDVGVFRTEDGRSWTSFNAGLPNTFVTALALDARSSTLTAATYGRSVHQIGLPEPQVGPSVAAGGVLNAASFQPVLAPGMIASVFGSRLAQSQVVPAGQPLPTTLAGTTVTVNGQAAPLFFVSPTQVNFQVPFETVTSAVVQITTPEGTASALVPVQPASPGLLTGTISHASTGAAVDAANPAAPGEILTAFAFGLGITNPAVPTGAASPSSPLAACVASVTVTLGGRSASVFFAGLAPGFTGLYQVNFQVPDGVSGEIPLNLYAAGRAANALTLAVRP